MTFSLHIKLFLSFSYKEIWTNNLEKRKSTIFHSFGKERGSPAAVGRAAVQHRSKWPPEGLERAGSVLLCSGDGSFSATALSPYGEDMWNKRAFSPLSVSAFSTPLQKANFSFCAFGHTVSGEWCCSREDVFVCSKPHKVVLGFASFAWIEVLLSGEFSTPTPSVVVLHLLCIRNNLYSKSCAVTSFFCARNVFIKNKIPDTSRHSSGGAPRCEYKAGAAHLHSAFWWCRAAEDERQVRGREIRLLDSIAITNFISSSLISIYR